MDYERKYNDALEKARFLRQKAVAGGHPLMANHYEQIFPELAESEEENIRKELIEFLREAYSRGNAPEECAKWLVYLDKQKEQHAEPFSCGHENGGLSEKPNNQWSEEDNNALDFIHELISFGYTENFFDAQTAADMRKWIDSRIHHWRPSEEMINSLRPQPKQENEPLEIKYAEKIYKVYGTKELPGGVVGYIIEDEPEHYDCIIHPDEVIGGYGIKSNGSPYPTKEANFS